MARSQISISEESETFVERFAKSRGIEKGEAIDKLLHIARSRVNALDKYAHTHAAPKAAKKPAKKPAKKAAKAKGPIARKTKAAKAEAAAQA